MSLNQLLSSRSLNRDQRSLIADIPDLHVALDVVTNPCEVLVDVGRVDHKHQMIGEPIDKEIVDDATVLVAHGRVAHLMDLKPAYIVRHQTIDRGNHVRASDPEF